MGEPALSPRQRLNHAINHEATDRVPRDFAAAPEIWEQLSAFFDTRERGEILDALGVDCRVVSYDLFCDDPNSECHPNPNPGGDPGPDSERPLAGAWQRVEADGSYRDIWGAHRAIVLNAFGALDQFASFPLEHAESIDHLRSHRWPSPAWWDFSGLRGLIESVNANTSYHTRYRVGGIFETAWSLMGFEKAQLNLALNPALLHYMMERITEVHEANLQQVLDSCSDLIDTVYFFDDVASQNSLLMSPKMYASIIAPYHQRIIDLAARFDKPVMMHCCGAVYPLIERFIDMGLSILNPVQPSARDMNPEKLANDFGGRIAFHGGIDVQQFLPFATPEQVRDKVRQTCEVLGQHGGYIMSGSHHLQADIPLENVLAMYGVALG